MLRAIRTFASLAVSLGITGLFAIGHPADLQAQTIFCPATFPGTTPVHLSNGSCTNGSAGAFSGAALASQALTEVSQTTTQVTTKEIGKAIVERREQERERCPAGFSRVDGACRPVREPARAVPREKPTPAAVVKAPPPPPWPIEPAVRFGTWAEVYGDYQKRDAAGPGMLNCCTQFPLGDRLNVPPQLALNIESRTGTVGFVAGADLTSRGLLFANDGFIAGVTAGYTSSELKLNTVATDVTPIGDALANPSVNSGRVPTGVSSLRATVSGPTVGGYATYFNGGFSTDFTAKFDFLTLNETFNDLLATTGFATGGIPPPFVPFSGAGSVGLLNSTVVSNFNYRFDLYPNFWVEPTVGVQYTNSSYGSGASQLGLADGNLVRVQGGARFGTSTLLSNSVLMTTTLTGLAYNDVVVQGGSLIPASSFNGNNLLVQADQGLMRGEGILALNFDFRNGWSSLVLGDVYGGAHLFGAGGKAAIRYQW
jgi:hypothetical protein